MGPRAARLAAPAAFLLAATIAILLVRAALHDREDTTATRPATAARTAEAAPQPPPRPRRPSRKARAEYYVIREGDTLAVIAARHDTTIGRLVALNPELDPASLQVGQRIRVR